MLKAKIEGFILFIYRFVFRYKYVFGIALLLVFLTWQIALDAEQKYQALLSVIIYDRNNAPLSIRENAKGHYVLEIDSLPPEFESALLKKEDRFFYYHFGINPISSLRAFYNYVVHGRAGGSSTLTQQLAKNILATESDRNIKNKLIEAAYAVSLELFCSKAEILNMYSNTVYLGNQVQGFGLASYAYFDKPLTETSHSEQISLLATLSYPSSRNPWATANTSYATDLNNLISSNQDFIKPDVTKGYSFRDDAYFEMSTAGAQCNDSCHTTIDAEVTKVIRSILGRYIDEGWSRNIKNGAVVVINAHNLELLAMVGSKNPQSESSGNQINMAITPRPIGSTIKPFIYAKGFESGLRPYTLVEDREYKYPIANGFALYPKNYDGQYRGEVTLHEALSNSLNVPSVKVLEYIGLDNFYTFLRDSIKFEPLQDLDSYQYGIALGGLEMDLTTLTHYFTLFPQKGYLSPLKILLESDDNFSLPPQSHITKTEKIIPEEYTELVHAIINDRYTGVNQFGLAGNLNLTSINYGVKTGTSRDFHDSWVVGYTPDFVVGVWLGNAENTPLTQVSGSSGAGAVWHDVMEYLLTTQYNKNNNFSAQHLERIIIDNNDEWGLKGDVESEHRNLLISDNLILSIHTDDIFELNPNLIIPLKARKPVVWTINGQTLDTATETNFTPDEAQNYEVSAYDEVSGKREIILIQVKRPE